MNNAYSEAERILGENTDKLKQLAETLLERETMDGRDVEALVKGEAPAEPGDGAPDGAGDAPADGGEPPKADETEAKKQEEAET